MTKNNEISDITLYSLGLMTTDEMESLMMSALMNKDYESKVQSWTYEDICNIRFRLLLNTDYYKRNAETGTYDSIRDNAELLEMAIRNAPELKIVGIVRPAPDSTASMISGSLAYTSALTDYIIQKTAESEIVQEQIKDANKNRDLLTGLPFVVEEDLSNAQKVSVINAYLKSLSSDKKAEIYMDYMCTPSEDYLNATVSEYMKQIGDRAALEDAIAKQYAKKMGVSENTVREYLASYTDEELNKMVETALREMITQQYASQKKEEIRKAASKPDEETLQQAVDYYRQMVLAQCGNDKSAYLVYYFKTDMELDDTQSAAMVAGMSAEDVERIFEKITAEQAQALLESQFAITEEQINNNIAYMLDAMVADADEETTLVLYEKYAPSRASDSTYENNLKLLGVVNPDEPSGISIYATTFEDKDAIADIIENYNETKDKEDQISYTDYVALIMSSVTTIINVISYVLIAFVSISLVVSSIMIGIITYISVLERTKEIGVLRSIGASKRDVSRVFNAETMIIGLCAGLIGIAVTVLLCIPISAVVQSLSGIPTIYASLPLAGGVILVAISVALTLIAGLIPSRIAAKKDPVEALRSE
ncbi:aBC transporter ATP-binding protein [Clostridium sp. CAG:448]|nr:aBC transporter ATP-binding protein [Clostridium sp. CAG:448]